MPSTQRQPDAEPRYTMAELSEVRRYILLNARLLPPGEERNQRRQVALSLRRLFEDPAWLDNHTVEFAPRPPAARGLRSVVV